MSAAWDVTALVNAADARASLPQRHLWLARAMEWLRHAPDSGGAGERATPLPAIRLRHLLNVIDRDTGLAIQVRGLMQASWREVDAAALFADYGFGGRQSLASELAGRLRRAVLPGTPATTDLAALFDLLFDPGDGTWLEARESAGA